MLTSPPASLHGARHPRVEVAPTCADSFGPEAIELAHSAGLELDFWQQQALTLMLSTREDGRWACFEFAEIVARQNGKGALLEARALAGLLLLGEQLIMWSAHEYKTAMEGFRRFRALLTALGEQVGPTMIDIGGVMVKVSNTNGEESFERLDTGQRVKFIARSKGSGRGFSGDVNFIDEAFAYTPEQQSALMPTMSARPNPQLVYTSSPPLDGGSGEILYQLRSRAENGGDDSLGYRDWGVAGDLDNLQGIDLDDRQLWAASNPALGTRIGEETILRNRRSMSDVDFAREILGVWPKQHTGGGAIDVAQWAQLADETSKRAGAFALGVDIAPNRDYAAIALYGTRADEIGHGQLVDYRAGTDWIVPRLRELAALEPVAIGMGRGTAASLSTELEQVGITVPEDYDKPNPGDLAVIGGVDMAAACGQLIDDVRQGAIRHLAQHQLDVAVAGARTRETADAIAWSRKDADTDIAPLVALTTARRALVTRIDAINHTEMRPMFAFA